MCRGWGGKGRADASNSTNQVRQFPIVMCQQRNMGNFPEWDQTERRLVELDIQVRLV